MSLFDVLPRLSSGDLAHLSDADAEVRCDGSQTLALSPARSNRSDVARQQFCSAVSALGITVLHIGEVIPDEQMVRSRAWGIVATVADIQPVWHWAEMNLPGDAVCPSLVIVAPWTRPQQTITEGGGLSYPSPASDLVADDLLPIAFLQCRHDLVDSPTPDRTKATPALISDGSHHLYAAPLARIRGGSHVVIVPKAVA